MKSKLTFMFACAFVTFAGFANLCISELLVEVDSITSEEIVANKGQYLFESDDDDPRLDGSYVTDKRGDVRWKHYGFYKKEIDARKKIASYKLELEKYLKENKCEIDDDFKEWVKSVLLKSCNEQVTFRYAVILANSDLSAIEGYIRYWKAQISKGTITEVKAYKSFYGCLVNSENRYLHFLFQAIEHNNISNIMALKYLLNFLEKLTKILKNGL